MPIQKGKKRRKPRSHGTGDSTFVESAAAPSKKARPAAPNRRFQAPLWLNLALGTGMLIFGIAFFVISLIGGAAISTQSVIILVLYVIVAGLYLGKAWKQRTASGRQ